jgi:hypothetical protein
MFSGLGFGMKKPYGKIILRLMGMKNSVKQKYEKIYGYLSFQIINNDSASF